MSASEAITEFLVQGELKNLVLPQTTYAPGELESFDRVLRIRVEPDAVYDLLVLDGFIWFACNSTSKVKIPLVYNGNVIANLINAYPNMFERL